MTDYPAYRAETLLAHEAWARLMAEPRYADPLRLPRYGAKIYAQNDEDGILAEVFRRIGVAHRRFVEIGLQDGTECNSLALLLQGWAGRWVEADAALATAARHRFAQFVEAGALEVVDAFAETDTIDALAGDGPLDLLSIDVDGNDFHLWRALDRRDARVVLVEYNASWAPPLRCVSPYRPGFDWAAVGDNGAGASLGALATLGEDRGYRLVGCSASGVNAFFVRADLVGDRFAAPFTAENHFEPPRYWMHAFQRGHRNGFGGVEWPFGVDDRAPPDRPSP